MDARDDNVVIKLRDVYDIAKSVESKVDLLSLGMTNGETIARDHEQRLRTVERRVFSLPSLAVLLAIGSLIVGIVALSRNSAAPTTPSGHLSAPKVTAVSPSSSSTSSTTSSVPTTSVVALHRPSSTSTTTSSVPVSSPVTLPPVTVPAPPSSVTQLLERIEGLAPVTVSLRP